MNRILFAGLGLLLAARALISPALAASFEGPELYPGERALADAATKEGIVVAGNVSLGLGNWAAVVRAFGIRYPGITVVHNDLGSTAVVAQLDRQREKPVMDTVYYFGLNAIDAASRGLLQPFKPLNAERLPPAFRDPEGQWIVVHHMPVAILVNRKLVKTVPRSWADLQKPDYKGTIVYFDPTTTTVGLMTALAANAAAGGTLDSLRPTFDYFAKLHRAGNVKSVETQTPYARFLRGEIAIWLTFEADGLRARQADGMEDAEVVLPSDGTAAAPYAMSMVKGAPDGEAAKLWMNFVMSEPAQKLFAEGFVRPALREADSLPPIQRLDAVDSLRATLRKPDIDRTWPRVLTGSP